MRPANHSWATWLWIKFLELQVVDFYEPSGYTYGGVTRHRCVVNLFESKKVNVIFAKDKQDNIFGIQRIHRKRKKFDTANFKIKHTDLFNKFTSEIEYNEYKALGDTNA